MKKILAIAYITLLSFTTFAQNYNQNVNFTRTTLLSGKTMVQDTSLYIKSGNDTIRISNYGDTSRFTTTATAWKFTPELPKVFTNNANISVGAVDDLAGFGIPFAGSFIVDTNRNTLYFNGVRKLGDTLFTSVVSVLDLNTFQESILFMNYFPATGKQGIILKSTGKTGEDFAGVSSFEAVQVHCLDQADTVGFSVTSWAPGNIDFPNFQVSRNGISTFATLDSAFIYSKTPSNGSVVYCSDCSGDGITGRLLSYIGAAWRRLTFED